MRMTERRGGGKDLKARWKWRSLSSEQNLGARHKKVECAVLRKATQETLSHFTTRIPETALMSWRSDPSS